MSTAPAGASITNTRIDAWGTVELSGAGWLGGAGVDVYSNGSTATGPVSDTWNYVNGVRSGIEWQCVELVNRLYLARGWIATRWPGNGNQLYGNAPVDLVKQLNGSITYLNPGDVITLDDGGLGHAGVVNAISGSTVQIVNQNTSAVYSSATYTGTSLIMSGWSNYAVQGVIHAPIGNAVAAEGPTIASAVTASGVQVTFWKGTDEQLYEAWYDGSWHRGVVGGMGPLGSAPTVAINPATGQQNVFWRGTNGQLWQAWWLDGVWHGPSSLGSSLGSAPTAAAFGNTIVVFWKGLDRQLWAFWWDGSQWNGPIAPGFGAMDSAPTVAAYPNGTQIVFWKGTDNQLYEAWYDGSWHGGVVGMGPLGSSPSASIRPVGGEQNAFWKGADGHLWQAYWDGIWHGPYSISMGILGSAPSVTAWNSDVYVFWRGSSIGADLWAGWYTNSTWNGPASPVHGPIASS